MLQLDLSLARGLSYYTGIIFEAVLTNSKGVNLLQQLISGLLGVGRGRQLELLSTHRPDYQAISSPYIIVVAECSVYCRAEGSVV